MVDPENFDILSSFGIKWEKNTRGGNELYILYKTEKERADIVFSKRRSTLSLICISEKNYISMSYSIKM